MFLHHRFVPGLAIHSYMVGDEKSKECAVIDPTRDVDEYITIAKAEGLQITHVLETHVHADFVSGAVELKARLPYEARIHCSGLGGVVAPAVALSAYAQREDRMRALAGRPDPDQHRPQRRWQRIERNAWPAIRPARFVRRTDPCLEELRQVQRALIETQAEARGIKIDVAELSRRLGVARPLNRPKAAPQAVAAAAAGPRREDAARGLGSRRGRERRRQA